MNRKFYSVQSEKILYRCIAIFLAAMLTACGGGGGGGGGPSAAVSPDDLEDIVPYVLNSPYSDVLASCALAENSSNSCSLTVLPLLIMDTEQPSVDDIMARTLVSHDWMGLRFRQVLETLPDELLSLFAAVATVVIDADIRPSHYIAETSTIYLDSAYLWLLNSEKTDVTQIDDFRSDFADELSFISLARNVLGNDYAWFVYDLNDNIEREIEDIRLPLAQLLLHELAHANDFFPPGETPFLSFDQSIYQALLALEDYRISAALDFDLPLQSKLMAGLGAVMYQGVAATTEQKALTAIEVGEAMETDGASDDYAYSTIREDVAMLFTEAMMKYLFDIDRDIAYVNVVSEAALCDEYVVEWGVRGRIGDETVNERAQFVVDAVYPNDDFSLFFQDLEAPSVMVVGESWCDNLDL